MLGMLRESAMSSLDGSMKVYPVQMVPINWFQILNFFHHGGPDHQRRRHCPAT